MMQKLRIKSELKDIDVAPKISSI